MKNILDISESTLLFEISGEVVSLEYLLLEKINLKNKKFCYFIFLNSQFNRLKDFIFVRKKGNISFFFSKANPLDKNVGTQLFFTPRNNSFVLLAYAKTNIKKNEILKTDDIYLV